MLFLLKWNDLINIAVDVKVELNLTDRALVECELCPDFMHEILNSSDWMIHKLSYPLFQYSCFRTMAKQADFSRTFMQNLWNKPPWFTENWLCLEICKTIAMHQKSRWNQTVISWIRLKLNREVFKCWTILKDLWMRPVVSILSSTNFTHAQLIKPLVMAGCTVLQWWPVIS